MSVDTGPDFISRQPYRTHDANVQCPAFDLLAQFAAKRKTEIGDVRWLSLPRRDLIKAGEVDATSAVGVK